MLNSISGSFLENEPNRLTYPMEVSILGILGIMFPF